MRRAAFSLAETLLALLVVALLCGGMVLVTAEKDKDARLQRDEVDRLAVWLTDKMAQAQAQNCSFRMRISQWEPNNYEIRLWWLDSTNEIEVYRTDRVKIWTSSYSTLSTYDAEWHTLTPAVTFRVKMTSDTTGTGIPVTISGQGYVSVGS